jgi:hypothetical protein
MVPEPPKSIASAVLNGVGNGAMIGAGLFAVPEAGIRFFKPEHEFSHNYFRAGAISAAAGALIGAYYSYAEAKQENAYRSALYDKLVELDARQHGTQTQMAR